MELTWGFFAKLVDAGDSLLLNITKCSRTHRVIFQKKIFRLVLIYFFIVIPILEATPLQASIGKKVMRLMVINQYGERIAWYQSFFRNWLTIVNLFLLRFIWWINLIFIYKYNTLPQDSLSRSYVTRSR